MEVAVWLHAPRRGYGETVTGARLTLGGLAPGRWRVTWLDDVSGAELRVEDRTAAGDVVLTAPPFARHVAALAERVDERRGPGPIAEGAADGRRT